MSEADSEPDSEAADDSPDLEALLQFLRDRRGFDFTGYKRPSLTRRIRRRMQDVGVASYPEYLALLESEPSEFASLFDTILINVTAFRRDPDVWDLIEQEVVPQIVRRADDNGGDIRVWSAGCATGEEAYTLAVILAEAMGEERFQTSVKIYATDADENALAEARQARFPHEPLLEAFGEERTERFFEPNQHGHCFRPELRRSLIFGRHDLVQDPPISRLDLVSCRNTLMYFNADVQRRALSSFHFALVDSGYLVLGKAEALVTRTNLFDAVDLKRHVFRKRTASGAARPPLPGGSGDRAAAHSRVRAVASPLVESAFEISPTAQLAIDAGGVLIAANRHARSLFGLGYNQVGALLRDLEVSYRPVELRSLVDQATSLRRPVTVPEVEHRSPSGATEYFDVVVHTVERDSSVLGTVIAFVDVTRFKLLQTEIEHSQRELEVAHEELQSAVEELETTNEELQSTNEELETTNEELHSSNEELETMNEELQSTNEELESVNNELRATSQALQASSRFFEGVLHSLQVAVVVLDDGLTVASWNRQAEDLWGLRVDEVVGTHFLNLDIGLPVDQLRSQIRAVVAGEAESERVRLRAVNRRGRTIELSVTVTRLRSGDEEHAGVILVMEGDDSGGSSGTS